MPITLRNNVPESTGVVAEFHVLEGIQWATTIDVAAASETIIPTRVATPQDTHVETAQTWTIYAIVNGVTTETVTTESTNATITLSPASSGGYSIAVT